MGLIPGAEPVYPHWPSGVHEGFEHGYWHLAPQRDDINYLTGYWMGLEQVRIDEVEVHLDEEVNDAERTQEPGTLDQG